MKRIMVKDANTNEEIGMFPNVETITDILKSAEGGTLYEWNINDALSGKIDSYGGYVFEWYDEINHFLDTLWNRLTKM